MTETKELEQFAELVAEALYRNGKVDGEVFFDVDDQRLHVKDGLGRINSTIFLGNFFRQFASASEEEREVIVERAATINDGEIGDMTDLEAIQDDLLPVIRPRWVVADQQIRINLGRIRRPDDGQLPFLSHMGLADFFAILIARDLPDRMVLLNSANLSDLGITLEDAWEIAFNNLVACTPELEAESVPDENGGFHLHHFSNIQDGYMATRMLLEPMINDFPVKGDYVFGLIGDQSFSVTGSDDEIGLGILLAELEQGQEVAKPLPPFAIRFNEAEGYSIFMPEYGHPLFLPYNRLQLQYIYDIYEQQKMLMEGVFEIAEKKYFIADYNVWENEQGDCIGVCDTVAEQLPVLLPQTEYIQFVRDGQILATVSWYTAAEVIGEALLANHPGENWFFPPRFLLAEFPTEEALKKMIELSEEREEG